jgi:sodium transport system permease protein
MHAILTVFLKEVRESLRDRRTLWSALGFGAIFSPLLFAAILSFTIKRNDPLNDKPVALAVSHAERAPNLVSHLVEYGITVEPVSYDDAAARAAVQDHRQKVVLMIPEDYVTRFAAGQPAPLQLYSDSSDQTADRDVRRTRSVLAGYGAVITQLRLIARGIDPTTVVPIAVHDVDVSTPASRSVIALGTVSVFIFMSLFMGGMYLAIDATAGERERGSLESLLTVPVRRDYLIYGKILAACAFMTVSLIVSVTALSIVLRRVGLEGLGMSVNFGPMTALMIVLCCLPLIPFCASIMTIIAAYTRSYREAQTYLGLITVVPILPMMFASMMGLQPNAALMATPSMSQHFLITSLLRDEAVSPMFVCLSVGVSLGLGLVLAGIAGRLYQREALLG